MKYRNLLSYYLPVFVMLWAGTVLYSRSIAEKLKIHQLQDGHLGAKDVANMHKWVDDVSTAACTDFVGSSDWVSRTRASYDNDVEFHCDESMAQRTAGDDYLPAKLQEFVGADVDAPALLREWSSVVKSSGASEELLDDEKHRLNGEGIVMNSNMVPKSGHIPVWLRAFRRTTPLDEVLAALMMVNGISDTVLVVTVDGKDIDAIVDLVAKVTKDVVRVRLLFHPFTKTRDLLEIPELRHARINAHFYFGLRAILDEDGGMGYPYVISLEDDTLPLPDFYEMHHRLWTMTQADSNLYSIQAYARGPCHDCVYLRDKLSGTGPCSMEHTETFTTKNVHFDSWGTGIPRRLFARYARRSCSSYFSQMPYDALVMLNMHPAEYSLVPCSTRVQRLPNIGVNGPSASSWDLNITAPSRHNGLPFRVLPCPPDAELPPASAHD